MASTMALARAAALGVAGARVRTAAWGHGRPDGAACTRAPATQHACVLRRAQPLEPGRHPHGHHGQDRELYRRPPHAGAGRLRLARGPRPGDGRGRHHLRPAPHGAQPGARHEHGGGPHHRAPRRHLRAQRPRVGEARGLLWADGLPHGLLPRGVWRGGRRARCCRSCAGSSSSWRGSAGEIPGARPEECGNYLDQNLPAAQWWARRYLERTLDSIDEAHLAYA